MWDAVKCFAQVHVGDTRCSSRIYQHHNPVVETHRLCQTRLALNEAMLEELILMWPKG